MIKVIVNRKEITVSAAAERALLVLKRNDFAAMRPDFMEGSPRWSKFTLPADSATLEKLGVREVWRKWAKNERELKFFREHPRCKTGIFGDERRINAILKRILEKRENKS